MSGKPLQRASVPRSKNQRLSKFGSSQKSKTEEPDLPFFKEDHYTDTVLIVEGKKLFINKCLLGYASSHFHKLLNDTSKSAATEKKGHAEIKINDKSYQDFVDLLTYLHPAASSEVSESTALRLLPLADVYDIKFLKEKCEKVLVSSLRKYPHPPNVSQGTPDFKNKRDDTPAILLKCLKSADVSASKPLLEECVKIYSDPELPLKGLRGSSDVSHQVKARIFENRMENASNKMSRIADELENEKHEKELLKKQLKDIRSIRKPKSKINSMKRIASDSSIETDSLSRSQLNSQLHHYTSHNRIDKNTTEMNNRDR